MADAWPGTLPQYFSKDGYSEVIGRNVVEVNPETGPDLARRRATAVPKKVTGTMTCTASQYDTLLAFFKAHATVRFSWLDVRGATRYYRFAEAPHITMMSGLIYEIELVLWEFLTEFGGA